MRTKDDFIYYRECLFCGERFVSNRSNKTPLKFKRMGIDGARPETMCCNGRCAALRKAHGTFERYVLAEQMEDAAAMLADYRTAMQYRMVSRESVDRIQKQVREMGRRLIKRCRACNGTAVFQKSLCDQCLRQRRKDQKGGGHRARCRKHGTKYELGVTIKSVVSRDGLSCNYCGIKTERWDGGWKANLTTLDHVIPISKGGDHTMDNCVIACGDCNSKKSDKIVQLC